MVTVYFSVFVSEHMLIFWVNEKLKIYSSLEISIDLNNLSQYLTFHINATSYFSYHRSTEISSIQWVKYCLYINFIVSILNDISNSSNYNLKTSWFNFVLLIKLFILITVNTLI